MAAPRIHLPLALQPGQTVALPPAAARHVQVLRLQPGAPLTLFGDPVRGGQWRARVHAIGRREVTVTVDEHLALEREPARAVHLAVGMPANERMDWLVEKATELGVASVQPLMTERSVLRLSGERADKKVAHWQAVAVAACEQCGGNRVPPVRPVRTLTDWLADPARAALGAGVWLSLAPGSVPLPVWAAAHAGPCAVVLGPEGGLTDAEEAALQQAGLAPLALGARTLRSETAALAALALLTLLPSAQTAGAALP
ncbi:Ribosomal RNA small subunit methyltransferase E [Tepidimonas thermarum]|uniref:Ribosomal RNA small subunit methyltransferase E n=1 Tax=Tepidimonas thermarum TaxID=335431 RepID=A0A554WWL8_9BURK|nr:16S rRNA (uracil(1498)-N(3))-methyltransferase [Tepidimonas thermarum]TSE27965.1 Ribosomal RNA small subunit methyltransferase E [Tepidimonas thermarum]